MGRINLYNVYDLDGNIVYRGCGAHEISKELGLHVMSIARAAQSEKILDGKYTVEIVGEVMSPDDCAKVRILEEWDKVRLPFFKVHWVKKKGDGVKCLRT